MRYIPNTTEDVTRMLRAIGADSFEELVAEVPDSLRLSVPLNIPDALDECALLRELVNIADRNADASSSACFLGGGAYDHFIPAVVGFLASRSEFVTCYTPYQAEVSQGTLQATYEFQSMVCELYGMDAANASMYDGASAMAEAALMAKRITKRGRVAVSNAVHPHYREVLSTYLFGLKSPVDEVAYDAETGLTGLPSIGGDTACVIVQYPNFFGGLEDIAAIAELAHANGALLVVVADPIAMGLLKSPGELGADIVAGEGQPLGIPLSYGGPYLGLFACKKEHLRQMPGRVVGETVDANGDIGYVLTLQAREQHIKRERATSNICTNEALMALTATIYMAALGKVGIREVGELCLRKSHYLADRLASEAGLRPTFSSPYFKEFAVDTGGQVDEINRALTDNGIIGGLDLGRYFPSLDGHMLIAVTEKRTKDEMDRFVEVVRSL
jgi:glycine dehydrogenase subunit 1